MDMQRSYAHWPSTAAKGGILEGRTVHENSLINRNRGPTLVGPLFLCSNVSTVYTYQSRLQPRLYKYYLWMCPMGRSWEKQGSRRWRSETTTDSLHHSLPNVRFTDCEAGKEIHSEEASGDLGKVMRSMRRMGDPHITFFRTADLPNCEAEGRGNPQ